VTDVAVSGAGCVGCVTAACSSGDGHRLIGVELGSDVSYDLDRWLRHAGEALELRRVLAIPPLLLAGSVVELEMRPWPQVPSLL
jgi:hypothetical protein